MMQSILLTFVLLLSAKCQGYEKLLELYNSKLHNSSYSPSLRPVRDQRRPMNVSTGVMLYSIVAVDDVSQSFTSKVFLNFFWHDEFMTWNPVDVENETMFYPGMADIWIPRFRIVNILQEDSPFKDENPQLMVFYDGRVVFSQGGLMTTSCNLDMTYYPFDEQSCMIRINFMLKRRPSIFIVSILMPLVALSLLNVLIFLIPVNSGEKISYGITVLLAQTVLMSIVTSILPRSSNSLPYITIYVFTLIALAVLTVIVSIVVVYLHHVTEVITRTQL